MAPEVPDIQPNPTTAPKSGSDPRQPPTRSPAPNSPGSATAPARRLKWPSSGMALAGGG